VINFLNFLHKEKVYDYDEEEWYSEYISFKSLYKSVFENVPEREESVEFELIQIMEIEDINEPTEFLYSDSQKFKITNADISHNLIDKIIYPNLFLHNTPCKLTSQQSYNIVGNYIKENINHSLAKITSDYDFCFTVKKIIPLVNPYKYQVNESSGNRPRYITKERTFKEIEIFEMTSKESHRANYTPIDEFVGINESILKQNIEKYCKDIISIINEPIKECEHCNGVGYIFNSTKKLEK